MQWVGKLRPGDAVYSREFGKQQKWRQGVIGTQTGPVSYAVLLDDDHEVHRHQDHVIRRETPEQNGNELVVVPDQNEIPDQHPVADNQAAEHAARYPQRERHTPVWWPIGASIKIYIHWLLIKKKFLKILFVYFILFYLFFFVNS